MRSQPGRSRRGIEPPLAGRVAIEASPFGGMGEPQTAARGHRGSSRSVLQGLRTRASYDIVRRTILEVQGTTETLMASSLAIEAVGLEKSFGQTHALTGLDLEIGQGKILGVLGPNGSGKTTPGRLLTTLLRPDRG